jgi:hypothetical protein
VKGCSHAGYGWAAEVPGDMHAKGYMSPGGFVHILQNVLMRKKITAESFGKKKFQDQNLNRLQEAVCDTSRSCKRSSLDDIAITTQKQWSIL